MKLRDLINEANDAQLKKFFENHTDLRKSVEKYLKSDKDLSKVKTLPKLGKVLDYKLNPNNSGSIKYELVFPNNRFKSLTKYTTIDVIFSDKFYNNTDTTSNPVLVDIEPQDYVIKVSLFDWLDDVVEHMIEEIIMDTPWEQLKPLQKYKNNGKIIPEKEFPKYFTDVINTDPYWQLIYAALNLNTNKLSKEFTFSYRHKISDYKNKHNIKDSWLDNLLDW